MLTNGTELEKVRAKQMISIVEEGKIQAFVPELAQLVIVEVIVCGEKDLKIKFVDDYEVKVKV